MLKDLAGIACISLPPGFEKTSEDCDFGHFVEFSQTDGSRICYWQKDNYFASEETAHTLQQALKRKPHFLLKRDKKDPMDVKTDETEYFSAAEALLQPGRVLPPTAFDISALKTQSINGKTVFRADFDAGNRFCSVLIWDADHEAGILRHLWIDGDMKSKTTLEKEFESAAATIEWM